VELAAGQTIQPVPWDWGPNLARAGGVTAYAPGAVDGNYSKLYNGKLEDWYYDGSSVWYGDVSSMPTYVEVRLPSAQEIGRVVVFAGFPWQMRGSLVDYELQYDDAGAWVTIEHVQEPTTTFGVLAPTVRCSVDQFYSERYAFAHRFSPVTTGKIRLLVHQCSYGGGATAIVNEAGGQAAPTQTFNVREIEIYGAVDLNIPPSVSLTAPASYGLFDGIRRLARPAPGPAVLASRPPAGAAWAKSSPVCLWRQGPLR
jgi:hypothetical protein